MFTYENKCECSCQWQWDIVNNSINSIAIIKLTSFTEEEPLLDVDTSVADQYMLYQVGRAEYKPFHEKMKAEDKAYFYPSMVQGEQLRCNALFLFTVE